MIYSEAAYFDGAHVAHCAAREDFLRLRRIAAQSRIAARSRRAPAERGHIRGVRA